MSNSEDIAIIGMTGRFPGANDIEDFWQNLQNGVESVTFFSDEELLVSGVTPDLINNPNYIKARPILDDIDLFDASFFGYTPREAEILDPQHRLFLETAWMVVEQAGYNTETYQERIGVFAGVGRSSYLMNNLYPNDKLIASFGLFQVMQGNDKDYLSTRVSYKLNLKGPSINVQTACSTSLVAVCLACQSLLNYQSDMALAGGVSVAIPQKTGYLYQQGGMYSHDGHCRAFDADAQGIIFGNGVGVVVLKRLEDALADGDTISAVIRGSAMNNDGAAKVGFTAPSIDGQAEAIIEALAVADVEAETINYVETHGAGTILGDPIELTALTQAFRTSTQTTNFCAVGSVKTNVGHLNTAAGVTGLIKTVLALKHKKIPPSLHFEQPNPEIDFANSPFYINTKLTEWEAHGLPRRAGVSSLGLGGTNAHLILEEAPAIEPSGPSRPWQLMLLSAKTGSALETATTNLVEHLKTHSHQTLADVAYTFQVGRRTFPRRRMLVCRSEEEAVTALETRDPKQILSGVQEDKERPVAFMFSGLGDQYVDMGLNLYQSEAVFREHVDRCAELLKPELGLDLRAVIYPNGTQSDNGSQETSSAAQGLDLRMMLGRGTAEPDEATQKLNQTYLAQPAVFVIEYAMAQLWMAWGVQPQALIGHSLGEYVVACLAGVLSLEEALRLVVHRARLIQSLPGGTMLAVPMSPEDVQPLLSEDVSLSAVNGPSLCVISGPVDVISKVEQQLLADKVACRRLPTSHAFHSKMMTPIIGSFTELVKTFDLKPPEIPYVSNVTGTWITASEATDPDFWARHLYQGVRFSDGIAELWQTQNLILLEVGPGQMLSSLALQHPAGHSVSNRVVLPSLRNVYDRQSDMAFILHTLGRLWLAGAAIDWSGFYEYERRHRLPLPTYPFERQRYWIDADRTKQPTQVDGQIAPQKKHDITDWFYRPVWKQAMPLSRIGTMETDNQPQCWLVFVDDGELGYQIANRLKQTNQTVITVKAGEQFIQFDESTYAINPQTSADYDDLLRELIFQNKKPQQIIHCWSVTTNKLPQSRLDCVNKCQTLGFYSLLFLTQAIANQQLADPLQIQVVTNNMYAVTGEEELLPEKATLLGPCKVIPLEYPHIACRVVDVVLPQTDKLEILLNQLTTELTTPSANELIAYRGRYRWEPAFEPTPLERTEQPVRLREQGVYLITGGLGELGLVISEYLAQTVKAKLILVGRSYFPEREIWAEWLSNYDEEDPVRRKIPKLQHLEKLGAEVLVVQADVINQEQMKAAVEQGRQRFGQIHGVIHAAGVLNDELIQQKSAEIAARVLAPKVQGTLVLDALFRGADLDFMVLFSSLASIVGNFGRVDYCAASAFLDAFAHSKAATEGAFITSINWDTWQKVEQTPIAAGRENGKQAANKDVFSALPAEGISPQEGVEAFSRILAGNVPQIVVSTKDIQSVTALLRQTAKELGDVKSGDIDTAQLPETQYARPNLQNAYVAPTNETEEVIANIWQKIMGIKQIGIYDNFFELGGHSLLAIWIIFHLREAFQINLPPSALYEAHTVADLALIVEEVIIAELENLTDDEALLLQAESDGF